MPRRIPWAAAEFANHLVAHSIIGMLASMRTLEANKRALDARDTALPFTNNNTRLPAQPFLPN